MRLPVADTLVRRARPWLGTIVEIGVPAAHEGAIEAGFAEIARIHGLMSFHEETSDLAIVRRARAGEAVEIDRDTVTVLRIAEDLRRESDGLFNVAVGRPLIRDHFLPRMDAGHLSRFTGEASDIEIVDDSHIRLHRPTLVHLGGIAKGYAVDAAVAALQAAGASRGIVNAGGDLSVFGDAAMPVEVRMAQGGYSRAFEATNCAIASSENSRTRRMVRGRMVTPHIGRGNGPLIIDQTVTVTASACVIADAMTKVAMIDPDLANRMLAAHAGQVMSFQLSDAA